MSCDRTDYGRLNRNRAKLELTHDSDANTAMITHLSMKVAVQYEDLGRYVCVK